MTFNTELSKTYRLDLNRWEALFSFMGIFKYYKYSIFKGGKLRSYYRVNRHKPESARVMDKARPLPPIVLLCDEFHERYQSNKYLVPESIKIDCK